MKKLLFITGLLLAAAVFSEDDSSNCKIQYDKEQAKEAMEKVNYLLDRMFWIDNTKILIKKIYYKESHKKDFKVIAIGNDVYVFYHGKEIGKLTAPRRITKKQDKYRF